VIFQWKHNYKHKVAFFFLNLLDFLSKHSDVIWPDEQENMSEYPIQISNVVNWAALILQNVL
jgi:hypothetical protein